MQRGKKLPPTMTWKPAETEMGCGSDHTGQMSTSGLARHIERPLKSPTLGKVGHRLETWDINEQRTGLCYPGYQGLEI